MDIRVSARVYREDGPRTVHFVVNVPDAEYLPELTPEQLELVLAASFDEDVPDPAVRSITVEDLDEIAPRRRYMRKDSCACAICLDEYSTRTRRYVRQLPCGHTFCSPCIMKWVSQHSASCPTCRQSLSVQ